MFDDDDGDDDYDGTSGGAGTAFGKMLELALQEDPTLMVGVGEVGMNGEDAAALEARLNAECERLRIKLAESLPVPGMEPIHGET